jgi:hypothetical protein
MRNAAQRVQEFMISYRILGRRSGMAHWILSRWNLLSHSQQIDRRRPRTRIRNKKLIP